MSLHNKIFQQIATHSFTHSSDFHTYNTCWSNLGCIVVPPHNTKLDGRNSVYISTVYTWNHLQKLNGNKLFYQLSPNKLMVIIKNLFLNSYNNCIICQQPGNLVSTENGWRNIIDTANIRKDEIHRRLQASTIHEDFKISYG